MPEPNEQTPPMQIDPALLAGTADLENREMQSHPGSTEDLESRVVPRMNPMMAMEHGEPSPQGPPPSGKEQFHNTMADFGHRAEANRAEMIGLDPSDPAYFKKLSALQAQHGAITQEKARYQMLHPWGGPESEHPGVLGKIGHVAGEIGNAVGNATLGAGTMSGIPGTEANLAAKSNAGGAEQEKAIEQEGKEATTAETEAKAGQYDMVPYGEPVNGVQQYVPKKDLAKLEQQSMRNTGAETVQGKKNEGALDVQENKSKTAEEIAKERTQSAEMIAKGHDLVRGEVARIHEAGKASKDPNALTNTMKTMKQQAISTLPGIDRALDETEKVAADLGPAAGRWNDFWQGKVGTSNPTYAHYKDEIAFVSSAVTLAHARGRMSNELFEHFQKMFDAGRQAPENMIQALNVAKEWLTDYANMGETPAAGGGGAPKQSFAAWKKSQGASNAPNH